VRRAREVRDREALRGADARDGHANAAGAGAVALVLGVARDPACARVRGATAGRGERVALSGGRLVGAGGGAVAARGAGAGPAAPSDHGSGPSQVAETSVTSGVG
jgi:hypothetical protein